VYNLPLALHLVGDLDEGALHWALAELLARHEALRTNFEFDGEGWLQVPVHSDAAKLPWVVEDSDCEWERVLARIRAETGRAFDLANDVKLRALLLRRSGEWILALTMHHIAVDGWSIRLLLVDLAELYSSRVEGRSAVLPSLPLQYLDFTVWQRELLRSSAMANSLAHWAEHLGGVLPVLDLPTDHRRPALQSYRSGKVSTEIPEDSYAQVRASSRAAGVTPLLV